ncbi:uncharacterized protein LOC131257025 isoform X2 [Magnolia sinica]|uniref:uncharacterized protein LOC131257025 isoform X2 n=1 Tax=Magnolia sinica TaxID=86752 RepID=UPI0026589403|nr:uncharacterized protein LOC131257025 isoform X2 [Magnolia sinica]
MGSGKRRLAKNNRAKSNRSLFIGGGLLSDFQINGSDRPSSKPGKSAKERSKSTPLNIGRSNGPPSTDRPRKPSSNPFGYAYPTVNPQEVSHLKSHVLSDSSPIVLVDSNETKIVGYVDRMPCLDPVGGETFTYDYGSCSVLGDSSHIGLGFCDEDAKADDGEGEGLGVVSPSVESEMCVGKCDHGKVKSTAKGSPPKKNGGFLSIGGVRLYTEDIELSEDENDETDGDLVDSGSSESDEMSCSVSAESSDSEGSEDDDESDSGLDVDDDVAEDYLDGIGGGSELLNAEWLVGRVLDEEDSSSSSNRSSDESPEKLGRTALQIASKEYGMKKPKSRKKHLANSRKGVSIMDVGSLALDDLPFVKDSRTASGKKKYVPRLPQSWPGEKMKNFKNIQGEKKKHRKELIAVKRRERMIRRGVDLEQINAVQRLASIYRLRSGCQGSGKKRYVTVTRTGHTCMPSSNDKLCLEKLLGAGDEYTDFVVSQGVNTKTPAREKHRNKMATRSCGSSPSSHPRSELHQSAPTRLMKNSSNHLGRSTGGGKKQGGSWATTYADQPVSFVSSGIMQVDPLEEKVAVDLSENDVNREMKTVVSSTGLGAYEMHTKGFGSKMLAKMGFMEGGGLGKDGQGMVEPIEAIKRPKSLGLGVEFGEAGDNEGNRARTRPETVFQKHTKRAGSKMAKAGFSEGAMAGINRRGESERIGAFERHTKGFGSRMMTKMGFVEGSGLGKDAQGIIKPLTAVKLPKSRGLGAKG